MAIPEITVGEGGGGGVPQLKKPMDKKSAHTHDQRSKNYGKGKQNELLVSQSNVGGPEKQVIIFCWPKGYSRNNCNGRLGVGRQSN